ncbi:heterogeneous nuclear ribonucleoprotein U-like protein 1 [Neocloeon triangulifer]|uniref:heterogeneous nuclear ribonucleoprotein U-like protein 1 n=1 Tax=Neocloeon triangulifer TaxID=2078957 RepID=UPI00286F3DE5|nr:heterogeneous nuclear ribonucleoprotein U-like protein 1 [Neocloeon triangulifer]
MSDVDLNKLKVVELKAELQARGLDTKGNKPVLVERLKEALEKEALQQGGNNAAEESPEDLSGNAAEEEDLDEEVEEAMLAEEPPVAEPEALEEEREPTPPPAPVPVQSSPLKVEAKEPEVKSEPLPSPATSAPQPSPQKEQPSPQKEEPLPQKEQPSPQMVQPPPQKEQPSPQKEQPSPQKEQTSPQKEQPSPQKEQPSPQKVQPSPQKVQPSPQKVQPSPQNEQPSPQKEQISPRKEPPAAPAPVVKEEPKPIEEEKVKEEVPQPERLESADKNAKEEPMETTETSLPGDKTEDVNNEEKRGKKRQHSPENVKDNKVPQEDEPEFDPTRCLLSWYDSDLNLVISKEDFLKAEPMAKAGFAYCWAGTRASYGLQKGKAFFEVMIDKYLDVSHLQNETDPNVLRVGWSAQSASMQLGEEELTYGYGGTGKISTNCKFSDYGKTFQEGSVIGAFLDMSGENAIMSYTVDGEDQGVAFTVPKADLKGQALFPHVLTKNCSFSCNFGTDEPWFPSADSQFTQIGSLSIGEEIILGPQRPASKSECEAIMMVGIPGCGKTFWANKYAAEHPEKHYNVLGTNNLIDKMKVMGLPRRRNYNGRWEELISSCTDCFNKLLQIAASRRRNYILDQTNVYATARQRKMQAFKGFVRIAAVVVPTAEELASRIEKREKEEGKDVPDSAVFEMKANFVLPVKGEIFDEVRFVEQPETEAIKIVDEYVKEANTAGYRKKDEAKVPRFDQKQSYGGYRSSSGSSGNTNSRYHTSQNRFGGNGGGGRDFRNQDYRTQRYAGGGGTDNRYMRRDNRDSYRGSDRGGGFRGAAGGAWRGNRDNRESRGYSGGGRPDFNRRGGGDFRRPQKDFNKDRGYNRPGGDRDRRNDRYSGAGGNQWSSGGSGSNYNSGGYGQQAAGYTGTGFGHQQRNYSQNQYAGYSSYSSYPNTQQQGTYSQSTPQTWSNYSNQPQQQQSYASNWQQYGGYNAAQSQQGYQQDYSGGYTQSQTPGNYSTAQK